MTVRDLMNQLMSFSPDDEVVIWNREESEHASIDELVETGDPPTECNEIQAVTAARDDGRELIFIAIEIN